MSASEVAPNPFWYAKSTAALTSRDRLSICVLAMFVPKSVNQLYVTGVGRPVKPPAWFWPAERPFRLGSRGGRLRRPLAAAVKPGDKQGDDPSNNNNSERDR